MAGSFDEIYALTARIPRGKVATYGQLARMLGNPRMSRIVGCALDVAPEGLPCHRVVNRFGGLSDAFFPRGEGQSPAAAGVGGRALHGGGPGGSGPLPVAADGRP